MPMKEKEVSESLTMEITPQEAHDLLNALLSRRSKLCETELFLRKAEVPKDFLTDIKEEIHRTFELFKRLASLG